MSVARKGILRYEAIFGRTYVSVGGETTTKDFVERLDLKPGMKVKIFGSAWKIFASEWKIFAYK